MMQRCNISDFFCGEEVKKKEKSSV